MKENIEDGTVCMIYVPTSEQVVDLLTKALTRRPFEQQITKLGIETCTTQLEGDHWKLESNIIWIHLVLDKLFELIFVV